MAMALSFTDWFKLMQENQNKQNRETGDLFERLTKFYLLNIEEYSTVKKPPGKDVGIDLIAVKDEQKYAVQCKFRSNDGALSKSDVDSFLANVRGSSDYAGGIIVHTKTEISNNLSDNLNNPKQSPHIRVIDRYDLQQTKIDWQAEIDGGVVKMDKKQPHEHQKQAIEKVCNALKQKEVERGKLIMACGTGKTFTSIKIVERFIKENGTSNTVLFLSPSLSLLQQSIREYYTCKTMPMRFFVVCSDSQVGRRIDDDDDSVQIDFYRLILPPTTKSAQLIAHYERARRRAKESDVASINIIFSTYHSINVIAEAQSADSAISLPTFDLIICDEAHNTAGKHGRQQKQSHFTRIHDADYIRARKRIYMTATPRVYTERARAKATEEDIVLCDMDDSALYGEELYRYGFGQAINDGILCDYKVLIYTHQLSGDEAQRTEGDAETEARTYGIWRSILKRTARNVERDFFKDKSPMKRIVAFTNTIKNSQIFRDTCGAIIGRHEYPNSDNTVSPEPMSDDTIQTSISNGGIDTLACRHIDGSMLAGRREKALQWLGEADTEDKQCRILSNAKCLTEGIDVPALDGIIFINERKSVENIAQAVGRVMRAAPNKKEGYVILPIYIPSHITDVEEYMQTSKNFEKVWQVLQALRSLDERFKAEVDNLDLQTNKESRIKIEYGQGDASQENNRRDITVDGKQLSLLAFKDKFFAVAVKRCGDLVYLRKWTATVGDIAAEITQRLNRAIDSDSSVKKIFDNFLQELQTAVLNPAVDRHAAIELLTQHTITRPIFNALFDDYQFADHNSISKAMDSIQQVIWKRGIEHESNKLSSFYRGIQRDIALITAKIDNLDGRQQRIREIYDEFFKVAFKKDVKRLGIAYTPIEAVDYLLHSANAACYHEFRVSLTDKNVAVIDPFVGTGSFIARLIDDKQLIKDDDLARKYEQEIFANEIMLLPYYLAAVNIEQTYHQRMHAAPTNERDNQLQREQPQSAVDYRPFDNIVLTDTFLIPTEDTQTSNSELIPTAHFADNNQRLQKQIKSTIRVIVGNPPYTSDKESYRDQHGNSIYPALDKRIRDSYMPQQKRGGLARYLYDSFYRALRWASDRLNSDINSGAIDGGIIAFCTNASFLYTTVAVGVRQALANEFSAIYILDLGGDLRSGDPRREGGNIFDVRVPIALSIFIKYRQQHKPANIYYHRMDDYLSKEEKLAAVKKYAQADGYYALLHQHRFTRIVPDRHGDWLRQRSDYPPHALPITAIFNKYSLGIASGRDAYLYNFSKLECSERMRIFCERFAEAQRAYRQGKDMQSFFQQQRNINWNRELKRRVRQQEKSIKVFAPDYLHLAHYRPFCKQHLYYDKDYINSPGQQHRLFPHASVSNRAICINGKSADFFSVLMTNMLPDLNFLKGGGTQCFSYWLYEQSQHNNHDMFATRHENITDSALKIFRDHYHKQQISKWDIFYYIYALFHHPDYLQKYRNNFFRDLPSIPLVRHFTQLAAAGQKLADLHCNYEKIAEYKLIDEKSPLFERQGINPKVIRMSHPQDHSGNKDYSKIIYNDSLTLGGIPSNAYEYKINNISAIEWIMKRYKSTPSSQSAQGRNKFSNDANSWGVEQNDPWYILKLLKKIITVSVQSADIINALPKYEEE